MKNASIHNNPKIQRAVNEFNRGTVKIAEDCEYSLDDFKTRLNNNILIVGGSGCGKTRNIVEPNLVEAVGSFLISDPKGNLYNKYREYLKLKGYRVISVDFIHPERSSCYNPMHYANTSQEIMKLANLIIDDNAAKGTKADPYWNMSSMTMMLALIGFMKETDRRPMTFKEILRLLDMGKRDKDDDECHDSALSRMFGALRRANPDSWACRQFDNANLAPCRTYDCTRSTLAAKFAKLDSEELDRMMSGQPFDFTAIACEKTAVFVAVSDTDRSMDTLANMFFSQAINSLCEFADNCCENNRLPIPVRFILDDFATNCRIEEFPRMISSIRSRAVSVMLLVQSEAQLLQSYQNDCKTIISNCDTYAYIGGNDAVTADSISYRSDLPPIEVLSMKIGECIVFRRGSRPVRSQLLDGGKYIAAMRKFVSDAHERSRSGNGV